MSCEYICDGCGKRVLSSPGTGVEWWPKPYHWYQRRDKDGPQDACSRDCIDKIAEKTGKTGLVAPW